MSHSYVWLKTKHFSGSAFYKNLIQFFEDLESEEEGDVSHFPEPVEPAVVEMRQLAQRIISALQKAVDGPLDSNLNGAQTLGVILDPIDLEGLDSIMGFMLKVSSSTEPRDNKFVITRSERRE